MTYISRMITCLFKTQHSICRLTCQFLMILFFMGSLSGCLKDEKNPSGVYIGEPLSFLGGPSVRAKYDFREGGIVYLSGLTDESKVSGLIDESKGKWTSKDNLIVVDLHSAGDQPNSGNIKTFKWEGNDLALIKSGDEELEKPKRFSRE